MLQIEYDPLLIAISIAVAILGSWTALAIAQLGGEYNKTALQKLISCANSAIVMGGSVWSMHFIAMLSLSFPVAVTYSFTETVASLALAVALSGLGIFIASQRITGTAGIFLGGALIGLGVVGMHYLGVSAIRGCGVSFDAQSVILSALLAMAGAAAGLWLVFRRSGGAQILMGSLVIGATVAWVHYTGMYATSFVSDPSFVAVSRPHLPQLVLAYAIAMAAISVCTAQLLMITGSATKHRKPSNIF